MNDLAAVVPLLGAVLVAFLWQGAVLGLLAGNSQSHGLHGAAI